MSEGKLLDVYREKPIRLCVKVQVPVKEHSKVTFNNLAEEVFALTVTSVQLCW